MGVITVWLVSGALAGFGDPAPSVVYERPSILVLGDSQARDLRAHGRIHRAPGYAVSHHAGRTTGWLIRWLDDADNAAIFGGKDVVYIQIGGNDISWKKTSADNIRTNIRTIISRVRTLTGGRARIVLGTVPVRGRWFDKMKRQRPQYRAFLTRRERVLREINDWIRALPILEPELRTTTFDVNAIVAEAGGSGRRQERAYSFSDVHLAPAGYRALSVAIQQHLAPSAVN